MWAISHVYGEWENTWNYTFHWNCLAKSMLLQSGTYDGHSFSLKCNSRLGLSMFCLPLAACVAHANTIGKFLPDDHQLWPPPLLPRNFNCSFFHYISLSLHSVSPPLLPSPYIHALCYDPLLCDPILLPFPPIHSALEQEQLLGIHWFYVSGIIIIVKKKEKKKKTKR